ncbi:MAG: heavy metal-binding domain-containing protein [Candidatus Methanomethylophilaceae archaeon]|nr:heavy metal-binding domain-containing protein [Thermoplasmata archaeon]MBQ2762490.1 heavy metal-binding domain-containing protein [Candidatus Methanomethylophilaceae archaeon]
MIVTTTDEIPGKKYEILGIVQGNMIQTKNIGRDFTQGMKSLVGGELKSYVDMVNESRATATKRMIEQANAIGADAIVGMRYTSSTVAAGAAEVLAFGTAVKFIE